MIDIGMMARELGKEGYSEENAEARVCQDIVLKAISESNLSSNVTIKGGVVMRNITGSVRRATQDMDFDFIRYSLDEQSISKFIERINCIEGISIRKTGEIEELSQQEYRGKRVYIILEDTKGNAFRSKIDLGVHKNTEIEQEEYCFDICMDDESVSLLINTKEQIFTEKLSSLLRFGPLSTRYKDIFDLCYLAEYVDHEKLIRCMNVYIFDEPKMKEKNINDIQMRISRTFANRKFRMNIEKASKANWLKISIEKAFDTIQGLISELC